MANEKQWRLFVLASFMAYGRFASGLHAGELGVALPTGHGLISNTAYNAADAATNKTRLVDAIKTGDVLTCSSGGTFWFDGPLPLPPAYRRNGTAYEIGDRVRGDVTRIYECITAGTAALSGGPTGTTDNQLDGTVRWDYIEEVGATPWTKEGLNIQGPNSQHSPQALEEYGYSQADQLRFIVRMDANSDTWMNLDGNQAAATWQHSTAYNVGDFIEGKFPSNSINLYVCVAAGTSDISTASGPTGTGANIPDGPGTLRWTWISQKRILTNINLRNFILQIDPPKPWVASRVYRVGDMVKNGDFIYICDTHGESAASGGPTGSGQDIADNTTRWDYTTLPGCGSGIKIGVPRQAASWISARGVRIDGVSITGRGQGYANPIDPGVPFLHVSNNYGLRCNYVYDLDASNCAVRGFATGWDLYHCDLPHVSYLHGMHSYRTLRHVSHPNSSARPGTYSKITVESNPGNAVELDSGMLTEPEVENGYAFAQSGEFALDAGTTWSIGQGLDTISLFLASSYLQPGMAVRLDLTPAEYMNSTDYIQGSLVRRTTDSTRYYIAATTGTSSISGSGPTGSGTGISDGTTGLTWDYAPWAGTDRILIIKDVFANSATFHNSTTQSYNSAAIPTCSGANFKRLMGVAVVGRTSRFSMRNPSLELNAAKPNLPLAVLQPGRETLYVDAPVNEKGNMNASNAYAIAANNAGTTPDFGTVQCSGRFLAPNHPLAIVFGSPASGVNNLRPVTTADQWGVGPEASYNDDHEGRAPFRLLDGQWTRLLSDHASGWRVPIAIPVAGVTELRYRILCKADSPVTLTLSCGYLADGTGGSIPGDASNTKSHALNVGWQIVEGTLPTDPGDTSLQLDPTRRNYFRLNNAAISVARVEAYPSHHSPTSITIASDAIAITKRFHRVDMQGAAATDNLSTINGGSEGDTLILRAENGARDVVVKDGVGNIQLNGDMTLNNVQDSITLLLDGTNWIEVARSDNGS